MTVRLSRPAQGELPDEHAMAMQDPDRTMTTERATHPSGDVVVLSDAEARVGGRTVWSHVNITVPAGQFVAILGPNGVGKSTLLRAVLGLQPTSTGQIRVLGGAPGRHNRQIGYLPQRRAFDAATRVRGVDIVRLGLDGDRWGIPLPFAGRLPAGRAAGARARVAEVIELVGATGYAKRPIGQCSGGEQQRLLIAQALVRRPELLLLDEPLDSLDVTNQASVSALVQSVCRSQGVAVMLVAHDVNPILPYLDQVLYLAHGGAIMGPPEQVITADTLTMLYGTPIDVLRDRTGRLVVVGQPDAPAVHGQHP
jgi:zinc/manganese transport system ATP-binding protein